MADQEKTAVRTLIEENNRLKQRLFEIEERLRKLVPAAEAGSGTGSAGRSVTAAPGIGLRR